MTFPTSGLLAATLVLAGHAGHAGAQTNDPAIPVGSLTASPTIVQAGTHPTLTWKITYPSTVQDVVEIDSDGTLTPNQDLHVDIRVLGAAITKGATTYVPVEAQMKYNGGSWSRLFFDTQANVHPGDILRTLLVEKNRKLDFGGRFYQKLSNSWSTFYDTTQGSSSGHVVALTNGDIPPSVLPFAKQPALADFVRPYVDSAGKIKIGPMDVIYLFELTHSDTRNPGFDLQDLCLLVTFRKV